MNIKSVFFTLLASYNLRSILAASSANNNVNNTPAPVIPISIFEAIDKNNFQVFQQHIMAGTDINQLNSLGDNVLTSAIFSNRTEMVQSILAVPDLNINFKFFNGRTALTLAVFTGNPDILGALLSHNEIIINDKEITTGYTSLFHACRKGKLDLILLLLHAGADETIIDNDDRTPFDYVLPTLLNQITESRCIGYLLK